MNTTDKIIKEFKEKFVSKDGITLYYIDMGKDLEKFLTKALKQAEEEGRNKQKKEEDKRFMTFWNDTDEVREKEWEIHKKAYGYGYKDAQVGRKPAPHDTRDGWCCACDYDIAVMERKIKELSNLKEK